MIYGVTGINQKERIEVSLNNHIYKLKSHYKVLMNQQHLTSDLTYYKTIENPKVISILTKALETTDIKQKNQLRDKLYNLLLPEYEKLTQRGVLQYHFVSPDNRSFLRFHKKSKYGDDLTDVRHDFKKVNDKKIIIRGFSQGRTAHAFRNVYPIFGKNNRYLGAIEISFTSEYLQDNLTNVSNIHTHFLVNKNIFESKAWKRDDLVIKYTESLEDKNYMISITRNHTKEAYKKIMKEKIDSIHTQISKNLPLGKEFAIYFIKQNKDIEVISFVPIKRNTSDKIIAWVVSYEKDDFIDITLTNTLHIRIILFFVLLVLFYFIYKTLIQKDNLENIVEAKTRALKELNENLERKIIQEVEKSKEIEAKLFQSEKMASMGEMIGNIAHQWRQPLSIISTGATGMLVKKEYGMLTDEEFISVCNAINENAQYLSQTIDDFRNYIKGNRKKTVFDLKNHIDSFVHLIEGSSKKEKIEIIVDINENTKIDGYPNELVQCFINIYNNAKDAFIENSIKDRYIFITCKQTKDSVNIIIKDSAGGISKKIIGKIFEPYFTTKHKTQGTGLGLHMTYTLIVEGMNGQIEVDNTRYNYKNNSYAGAKFTISLPIEQV